MISPPNPAWLPFLTALFLFVLAAMQGWAKWTDARRERKADRRAAEVKKALAESNKEVKTTLGEVHVLVNSRHGELLEALATALEANADFLQSPKATAAAEFARKVSDDHQRKQDIVDQNFGKVSPLMVGPEVRRPVECSLPAEDRSQIRKDDMAKRNRGERNNARGEQNVVRELQELKQLVRKDICLDEQILAKEMGGTPELTGGHTIQIGANNMATNNSIIVGTSGVFQAVAEPINSIFPVGKLLTWAADNADIVLTPSADTLSVSAAVPAAEALAPFNLSWSVTRTDGTVVNSTPLSVSIVSVPPPPPTELTGGHTIQLS